MAQELGKIPPTVPVYNKWETDLKIASVASTGPDPATAAPQMDGTAAVGSSNKYAKEDHVHPTDTSRAAQTALAAAFTAKSYSAGDLVTYNGLLYRCKSAYTATASDDTPDDDTTHWEAAVVAVLLDDKVAKAGDAMTGGLTVPNLTVGNREVGSDVGDVSVAEGYNTAASGFASHAEGYTSHAEGYTSHAEGYDTTASGYASHAEGYDTTASGYASHAEGYDTTASDNSSHAEGHTTSASGGSSHAEGSNTTASGSASHAEGLGTTASYTSSHAEGDYTTASGASSHAEGSRTTAQNQAEHAEGKYNASHSRTTGTAAEKLAGSTTHSIGIGTSDSNRKNAVEVMQDGKVFVKGVGGYDGTNPTGSQNPATDLATSHNAKQDAISDLSTIRSGAAAGATAVQPGGLRYDLGAPTVSTSGTTSSVTAQDRAINTIDLSSATTVTQLDVTFPAAATGKARDFFLRIVTAGTSLAAVNFYDPFSPNAADIEIGASELDNWNKAGTHLVMFTEIAARKFLASKRLEEASA